MENKLRSLVKKLGLEKNVYVHGYTKYADLVEKIKSASVIALPSLYKGQPVAALEAMAHRKPVVMYDFPFAREYISDWKDGLIAKGWDVPDLAHRIEAALSDKKLRLKLSENAYARVKRNHNWDMLVNDYINLYGNLRIRRSDTTMASFINNLRGNSVVVTGGAGFVGSHLAEGYLPWAQTLSFWIIFPPVNEQS